MFSDKLNIEVLQRMEPRIVVSYNYAYMIDDELIGFMQGNIVNLHISYLPWNKGKYPNIWSIIDNTPKGVTIHNIDKGLDTGKVIVQEMVDFADTETLATSYVILHDAITRLFKENWERIKNKQYEPYPQEGKGSYHTRADLLTFLQGRKVDYNMTVGEFRELYGRQKV